MLGSFFLDKLCLGDRHEVAIRPKGRRATRFAFLHGRPKFLVRRFTAGRLTAWLIREAKYGDNTFSLAIIDK